jgi:hypothetical protein
MVYRVCHVVFYDVHVILSIHRHNQSWAAYSGLLTIRQLKEERLYADSGGRAPFREPMSGTRNLRVTDMNALTTTRLPHSAVQTAARHTDSIGRLVRLKSLTLTTACRQAGLPLELAELCGGLLASVVDDLVTIGRLRRTDFERTKRKQRVLAAADEPAASALRLAIVASPVNGRAAVAHWDAICEGYELGKLAWLLGMDTETSYGYGRRMERRK